jgi:hypothetical protein
MVGVVADQIFKLGPSLETGFERGEVLPKIHLLKTPLPAGKGD